MNKNSEIQNKTSFALLLSKYVEGIFQSNIFKNKHNKENFSDFEFNITINLSEKTFLILEQMLGEQLDKISFKNHIILRNTNIDVKIDDDTPDGFLFLDYVVLCNNKPVENWEYPEEYSVINLNDNEFYLNELAKFKYKDKTNQEVIDFINGISATAKQLRFVVNERSKNMDLTEWLSIPYEFSNISHFYPSQLDKKIKELLYEKIENIDENDYVDIINLLEIKEEYLEIIKLIDNAIEKLKELNIKKFSLRQKR